MTAGSAAKKTTTRIKNKMIKFAEICFINGDTFLCNNLEEDNNLLRGFHYNGGKTMIPMNNVLYVLSLTEKIYKEEVTKHKLYRNSAVQQYK